MSRPMAKAKTPTSLVPAPVDPLDAAADAALKLAGERPWREITLRDIAAEAAIPFAKLYAKAPGKGALLDRVSRRHDRAALTSEDASADPLDRLFEATMARLEAMEPHRFALIAVAREEGAFSPRWGPRLAATARALLESAGIDTSGRRGALRIAAMTAVWVRIVQVWRDDEGALNRTMAEIDKRLKLMRKRLEQLGAAF
jgi:AcrR family transcriptional regulator